MVMIRSRIHEFFSPELLKELHNICRNRVISDNNLKVSLVIEALDRHKVEYVELGPGTNRLAILIDNYVFKIGLDDAGLQDNINEFTMSEELQPYVVKTYETNELISVCEYVTVISRDEFEEYREPIRQILSILSESYLLGDVGAVLKNFANWGYRDNDELVILDFAYVFRVSNDQLLCTSLKCKDKVHMLEYDENFHNLICPVCRSKYTFIDIRRRISKQQERHENEVAKQFAYLLHEPVQEFNDRYQDSDESDEDTSESLYNNQHNENNDSKEDNTMLEREDFDLTPEEEEEESYLETLQALQQLKESNHPIDELHEEEEDPNQLEPLSMDENEGEDFTSKNLIEVQRQTEDHTTKIRIVAQSVKNDLSDVQEVIQEAEEIVKTIGEVEQSVEDIMEEVIADEQQVIVSPDGESQVLIEEGHIVGPVSNEVVEDVFVAPLEGFLGNDSDEEDENEEDEDLTEAERAMMDIMRQEVNVTTVSLQDVDNDGEDEIVIDNETVLLPAVETKDEGEEVVSEQTIAVSDSITITNTVKVNVDSKADALRASLMANLPDEDEEEEGDIVDENKFNELAKDYSHLQEEADDYTYRKGNKDWK